MTSQPTNESELQLYRVLQRANLLSYYDTFICQGGDDVQQLCEAGEEEFLEIMALVGMASKPLHVRRLQKALQEWVSNPAMFQTPLVPALPPSHPSHPMNHINPVNRPGPVNLSQQSPLPLRPSPPIPMLSNNTNSGGGSTNMNNNTSNNTAAPPTITTNNHSSPSPGTKDIPSPSQLHHQQMPPQSLHLQSLPPYVMNMPEDDPRRMDEIRKYAAIYGRFDCKRKPEKPLTLHEVSVNEAAAQICKHIPALLTRRDELFPLARQVVRDSGYQYSKGHSSLDDTCRSQCYSKGFDEDSCKRPRLDPSPSRLGDKTQIEEEKKRRQDRLDAIAEQLNALGGQQEELKSRLQQARELQNFPAVNQIQMQLEQIATQQMQLINEQSELNKQIRRLERYLCGKGYGRLSTCSEPDKIDTDDTDSQFSAYSNTSSPTLSHDAHDSPSQDSNQSVNTTDVFSTIKMVAGKKTNVQITRQLVQETLMDEGLRVVKELANQIKQESDARIPPTNKPEGRPRGRPPVLDRDYKMPTLTHGVLTANNMITSSSSLALMSSNAVSPPVMSNHNGHSPLTENGPSGSSCSPVAMMSVNMAPAQNGLPECTEISDRTNDIQIGDTIVKSSVDSLNALLALSQKGIKQEPPSPSSSIKMD